MRDIHTITPDESRAILIEALQWLFANPRRHIAGEMAQDVFGHETDPLDPKAVCFCFIGRIEIETHRRGFDVLHATKDKMNWIIQSYAATADADLLIRINDRHVRRGKHLTAIRNLAFVLGLAHAIPEIEETILTEA